MSKEPEFDLQTAHRHFAAACFNQAWDLIDKSERSPAEEEQMIHLSLASLWHWTQRQDCTSQNLSIAYWQVSRVYALSGQAENARRYALRCLQYSPEETPFLAAYANEALARAAALFGNRPEVERFLAEARRLAASVADEEDRQALLDDLAALE